MWYFLHTFSFGLFLVTFCIRKCPFQYFPSREKDIRLLIGATKIGGKIQIFRQENKCKLRSSHRSLLCINHPIKYNIAKKNIEIEIDKRKFLNKRGSKTSFARFFEARFFAFFIVSFSCHFLKQSPFSRARARSIWHHRRCHFLEQSPAGGSPPFSTLFLLAPSAKSSQ